MVLIDIKHFMFDKKGGCGAERGTMTMVEFTIRNRFKFLFFR